MIKDLLNSKTYKGYKLRKIFKNFFVNLLLYITYFILIISLLYIILNSWNNFLEFNLGSWPYFFVGVGLIIFSVDVFIKIGTHFEKNNDIQNKKSINIFDYFCEDNINILNEAYKIAKKNNVDDINVICIMLVLSKANIGIVFSTRTGFYIDDTQAEKIISTIKNQSSSSFNQMQKQNSQFIADCESIAIANNHKNIQFRDMVLAIYQGSEIFSHILEDLNISDLDLKNVLSWTEKLFQESDRKYYWQKNYYPAGIGQDWASGNTPNLNMYATDISQYLVDAQLEYQSKTRIDLIQKMEDNLSKTGRNNILLVGEPGVGKTTLVNVLAQKIMRGKTYPNLNYKHVVQLDIGRVLSGVSSKGELEGRFMSIFNEAVYAGNIILYVKDIGQLVGNYMGEVGTINAAEFLLPYLESGRISVIASISYDDFKNKLQSNTSLETLFNKVEVKEMRENEVLSSIEHLISYIETTHHVVFTYQAVRGLIELAARYIHDEPFPQKVIDLLSEIAIKAEKDGQKIIEIKYVNDFMSQRIKMPVGEVKEDEKNRLLNLEKILHERVIGQDEAINAVADALRRSRAGLSGKKRPIGSFLFIGPTGVGKTETARALAEAYYGSEKNMIRFDMSEFQEIHTIDRLIGSKSGKQFVPGRLTQGVKNDPYTLVLFDEIEKSHPNILNLLLQVLDEGRLTDASGQVIDFTSTIIICTSNAGSEMIRQYLKDNLSSESMSKIVVDYLLQKNIFRPEFINRFDKVVFYKPLTLSEITQIIKIMINGLYKDLSEKNITLEVSDGAINKLAKEGYDPVFGARPMRRLIQEKVENQIAKKIISNETDKGSIIKIDENDV